MYRDVIVVTNTATSRDGSRIFMGWGGLTYKCYERGKKSKIGVCGVEGGGEGCPLHPLDAPQYKDD